MAVPPYSYSETRIALANRPPAHPRQAAYIQVNAMMPGLLHIIRLGQSRDKYDRVVADYQVTYDIGGTSYGRVIHGDEALDHFLLDAAALPESERQRILADLHNQGNTAVPDVVIPIEEAAPLGMVQEPSEF